MEKAERKDLVVAEAEEMIAKLRFQMAQGRRRLVNLEYERAELEASFPQWEAEIIKYEGEIDQLTK